MSVKKDPERNEAKFLHQFADFNDKRVLEIGCGEGRMTWQYARATRGMIGIDPDRDSLHVANADRPRALEKSAHFACADSQYLPFFRETFDIAVLAWSL